MVIPKNRRNAFKALRKKLGDRCAAMIAWAGKSHTGRSRMAKKAARTRKRRGR